MEITVDNLDQALLVGISGRLDSGSAPAFDARLEPMLLQPHPHILLDLAAVSYLSSAGLRSISQLVKHTAAHGGRVGLVATPPPVMEVIEISGFRSLLDLYPDRASAVKQAFNA